MPTSPIAAPGIPDRASYGDLTKLPLNQLVDYALQQHDALRAKKHFDLRLGTPELGHYSWAVRKGLPAPGQKHLAVQQPLHNPSWANFEGEIPPGQYGAGRVRLHDKGQALVTDVQPDALGLTLAHQRYPERYKLLRPAGNPDPRHWLMLNTTPTAKIPYAKARYQSIPKEDAEKTLAAIQPGDSVQAKIDGAALLAQLGRTAEIASYRTSSQTGRPIIHSERVFGRRLDLPSLPKNLMGTILRGELYGVNKSTGKAIPPQELGGILNASLAKALHKQKENNIELKNMIFNVQQLGKKPVSPDLPYAKRMELLDQVLAHLPADKFHRPQEARTPEDAAKLWRDIIAGKNPLTQEGVVIHNNQGRPAKIKNLEERDVYIRGTAPGKGKYLGNGVGAFRYALQPGGPTVGEVGTGLSDELRRELHQDPGAYLDRVARVRHQGQFPSGALRAPSLLALHEDY